MRIQFIFFFILFELGYLQGQIPVSARIENFNNRPTIFINNKPEYPMLYALTDVPGGRWSWEEVPAYNMRSFCGLGIRLIQVDLALDHVWKEDGNLVIDTVRRQLRGVIDNCPNAAIFIRLHVNPPKWWQKKFPQENTVYADREPKPDIGWGLQRIIEDDEETPSRTSLASSLWRTTATQKLKELLGILKELPEANVVAGIQVAGGVYGEWHYWGFIENEPDMSVPMESYFRQWLKHKYKTDEALRRAWHNSSTLATVKLPTLTERRTARNGVFRDPAQERNVIDYYEAQHEVVADDILHFCRVIKESWPRPIITGAFYGYFYALFGRDVAGGHLQLQRVLNSPFIDFLSGPGTYYPNAVEMGEPYRSRSLINSITLHGKLWLDEMDQQSPLLPLKDKNYEVSVKKSVAQVKRNIMFTLSKGQGLWFYDFGPAGFNGGPRLNDHGTFGWWDEPTVRKAIAGLKRLGEKQMQLPYRSDADVLVVHDTESFYHMASDKSLTPISHWGNNWPPVGIFKSGAVHDVIHLEDLERVDLGQYKVIVFMNTFLLTDKQKKMIREKVEKSGRHTVWIYAPGYSDGTTTETSNLFETTGFFIEKVLPKDPVSLTIDSAVVKNYTFSAMNSVISPLFVVQGDPLAVKLGTITGTEQTGFARKHFNESTSWYISLPPERPALWRYIFKEAGAHLYGDGEDVFYAGNGTLTIHSKDGGTQTIHLKNGKNIEVVLEANSTTILDPKTGEVLGN